MENLENDVKKPEILSDEQFKEVTGGGDPFAETLKEMNKAKCDSAKKQKDCEKMDFCIWKVNSTSWSSGACYYKG